MAIFRWGEFGGAVMQILTEVKLDENLLILADTWTNMEAAEAVLIAGINAKANAQLLVISRVPWTDARELNPSTAVSRTGVGGMSQEPCVAQEERG